MTPTALRTAALGATGLKITRVGFGAWAIGGGGYEWSWSPQDDEDSIAAIRHAVALRVNWIDTAAQLWTWALRTGRRARPGRPRTAPYVLHQGRTRDGKRAWCTQRYRAPRGCTRLWQTVTPSEVTGPKQE